MAQQHEPLPIAPAFVRSQPAHICALSAAAAEFQLLEGQGTAQ